MKTCKCQPNSKGKAQIGENEIVVFLLEKSVTRNFRQTEKKKPELMRMRLHMKRIQFLILEKYIKKYLNSEYKSNSEV